LSVFLALVSAGGGSAASEEAGVQPRISGVCPPFFLRDEKGKVIHPAQGQNATEPYSPKQTCGACHDYDKITEGWIFQQGRGEAPTPEMAQRYRWVTSPGNYGGTW